MATPTKADLLAAVAKLTEEKAKLTEENAALRDLIPAIMQYLDVPAAPLRELDEQHRYLAGRVAYMKGIFRDPTEDARHIQSRARTLAKWAREDPPPYRPVCDVRTGEIGADGFYCQLDPGHDGECSPKEPQPCPAVADNGHECTGRALHPLPHRTADGYEWDLPAADVVAALNPSAREVAESHQAVKKGSFRTGPHCEARDPRTGHRCADIAGHEDLHITVSGVEFETAEARS